MCAYVEARTVYPEHQDFLVVSLGTGENMPPLKYRDVRSWGLARWAQPIFNIVLDGASATADYQLRQLLPSCGSRRRYWRLQTALTHCGDAMDDCRPGNIRSLRLLAESLIRQRADDIELICAALVS
jgi:hypothetical protein